MEYEYKEKKKKKERGKLPGSDEASRDIERGKLPGSDETIRAIAACMNSGKGGIVTLQQTEIDARKTVSSEHFDKIMDDYFKSCNQSGNYEMDPFKSTNRCRKVFVKAIDQPKVLFQSSAYERLNVSSERVCSTESQLKVLAREGLEDLEPLELLGDILYGKKLERENEGKMLEFKDTKIEQVEKKFDDKCGKYISSFANTIGGHVLYGVTNEAIISDKIDAKEKTRFRKMVEEHVAKMVWYQHDGKCIQPQEGQHWKLTFVPVLGAPNGKQCMIVILTVPFFKGIVYCRSPQCPVLVAGQVKMLTCEEWCTHLKKLCSSQISLSRTLSGNY